MHLLIDPDYTVRHLLPRGYRRSLHQSIPSLTAGLGSSKLDEWCCITMMHQIHSVSDQSGDAFGD
jgi:hypothetical protein